MKLRLILCTLLTAVALRAADGLPAFNALMTMGKEHRFVLVSDAGKASSWLKLGATFEGVTIKAYDEASGGLDLERDGKVTRVRLVADAATKDSGPAALPATPATLADAEEVLRLMRFGEMMKKMMAQQTKSMEPMFKQMAGQMKGVDQEKLVAFQKKVMEEMMSVVAGKETEAAMAQAYSEVFSKEELSGLASFYGTPTGLALVDKQPEVSQKLNAILMPRMMQMMPKMKKMQEDFIAEQKAAAEQAPAPGKP